MHLRRALLLFALVLGMTALAASIAPAPRDDEDATPPATPTTATPVALNPVTLSFAVPRDGARPPEKRVAPGAHVVLTVKGGESGQATIPGLGRTTSVTAATPARFNLLVPAAGRYDVLFEPTTGAPTRVGTIVAGP